MLDYKLLEKAIYERVSTREYKVGDVNFFDSLVNFEKMYIPLFNEIKVKVKLVENIEMKNSKSSYCIAFYSERKGLYLENIGFIGQQISLYLHTLGIGSCWWGMKKVKKEYRLVNGLNFIINMVVGYPKKDVKRIYPNDFKRKDLNQIVLGNVDNDELIEVVRIAPSAINRQPWLIKRENNTYYFYLNNKIGLIDKLIKDMRKIDIGICLAHFIVKCKALNLNYKILDEKKENDLGEFIIGIEVD